jgi:hypothetical protein
MMLRQQAEHPHWEALKTINDPNAIAARALIECLDTRLVAIANTLTDIHNALAEIKTSRN